MKPIRALLLVAFLAALTRPAAAQTDDATADTVRLFAALESYVRQAPEQYLWLYKKFKGRPPPYPDVYDGRR